MKDTRIQRLSCRERMNLITDWSSWFYEHTQSFAGDLALHLAYLWPAVVRDAAIEVPADAAILALVRQRGRDRTDPIFRFIRIHEPDEGEPRVISALRMIVRDQEARRLDPVTGAPSFGRHCTLVDPASAASVIEVYEKLSPELRGRLLATPLPKMIADAHEVLAAVRKAIAPVPPPTARQADEQPPLENVG